MIIFRPQRGWLSNSMSEAKEFDSVEEMKKYIVKIWRKARVGSKELFTADDIVIDENSAMNDDRIGWEDSMSVGVKRMGNEDYMKMYGTPQCIGRCATKYKALN